MGNQPEIDNSKHVVKKMDDYGTDEESTLRQARAGFNMETMRDTPKEALAVFDDDDDTWRGDMIPGYDGMNVHAGMASYDDDTNTLHFTFKEGSDHMKEVALGATKDGAGGPQGSWSMDVPRTQSQAIGLGASKHDMVQEGPDPNGKIMKSYKDLADETEGRYRAYIDKHMARTDIQSADMQSLHMQFEGYSTGAGMGRVMGPRLQQYMQETYPGSDVQMHYVTAGGTSSGNEAHYKAAGITEDNHLNMSRSDDFIPHGMSRVQDSVNKRVGSNDELFMPNHHTYVNEAPGEGQRSWQSMNQAMGDDVGTFVQTRDMDDVPVMGRHGLEDVTDVLQNTESTAETEAAPAETEAAPGRSLGEYAGMAGNAAMAAGIATAGTQLAENEFNPDFHSTALDNANKAASEAGKIGAYALPAVGAAKGMGLMSAEAAGPSSAVEGLGAAGVALGAGMESAKDAPGQLHDYHETFGGSHVDDAQSKNAAYNQFANSITQGYTKATGHTYHSTGVGKTLQGEAGKEASSFGQSVKFGAETGAAFGAFGGLEGALGGAAVGTVAGVAVGAVKGFADLFKQHQRHASSDNGKYKEQLHGSVDDAISTLGQDMLTKAGLDSSLWDEYLQQHNFSRNYNISTADINRMYVEAVDRAQKLIASKMASNFEDNAPAYNYPDTNPVGSSTIQSFANTAWAASQLPLEDATGTYAGGIGEGSKRAPLVDEPIAKRLRSADPNGLQQFFGVMIQNNPRYALARSGGCNLP